MGLLSSAPVFELLPSPPCLWCRSSQFPLPPPKTPYHWQGLLEHWPVILSMPWSSTNWQCLFSGCHVLYCTFTTPRADDTNIPPEVRPIGLDPKAVVKFQFILSLWYCKEAIWEHDFQFALETIHLRNSWVQDFLMESQSSVFIAASKLYKSKELITWIAT